MTSETDYGTPEKENDMEAPPRLVCSICGSANWREQSRSVDDRYPIAKCQDHKDVRHPWSPLMPDTEFQKRTRAAAASRHSSAQSVTAPASPVGS